MNKVSKVSSPSLQLLIKGEFISVYKNFTSFSIRILWSVFIGYWNVALVVDFTNFSRSANGQYSAIHLYCVLVVCSSWISLQAQVNIHKFSFGRKWGEVIFLEFFNQILCFRMWTYLRRLKSGWFSSTEMFENVNKFITLESDHFEYYKENDRIPTAFWVGTDA